MSSLWIVVGFYQRVFIWLRRKLIARPVRHGAMLIAALLILLEGLPRLLASLIDPFVTFLFTILAVGPLILMVPFHDRFK